MLTHAHSNEYTAFPHGDRSITQLVTEPWFQFFFVWL